MDYLLIDEDAGSDGEVLQEVEGQDSAWRLVVV